MKGVKMLSSEMMEMPTAQQLKTWVTRNKMKTVFAGWATCLGGSVAYQWSRPIPMSLKLIHSRVYAQAFTVAALGSVALASYYDDGHKN